MKFTRKSLHRRILREFHSGPSTVNEQEDDSKKKDEQEGPKPSDILKTDQFRLINDIGIEMRKPWVGGFKLVSYNKLADTLFRNTDAASNEETMNLIIGLLLALPESKTSGTPPGSFRTTYKKGEGDLADKGLLKKGGKEEKITRKEKRQTRRKEKKGGAEAALAIPGYSDKILDDEYYERITGQTMPLLKGGRIKIKIKQDRIALLTTFTTETLKSIADDIRKKLSEIGLGDVLSEGTVRVTRDELSHVLREELSRLS